MKGFGDCRARGCRSGDRQGFWRSLLWGSVCLLFVVGRPRSALAADPPPATASSQCCDDQFVKRRLAELGLPTTGSRLREQLAEADSTRELPRYSAYFDQDWLPGGGVARLLVNADLQPYVANQSYCVFAYWVIPRRGADPRWERAELTSLTTRDAKIDGSQSRRSELSISVSFPGYRDTPWQPLARVYLYVVGYSKEDGSLLFRFDNRFRLAVGTPPALEYRDKRVVVDAAHSVTVMSRWFSRILALLGAVLAYLLAALAAHRRQTETPAKPLPLRERLARFLNPIELSAGAGGDASMSQLQVVLFTLILGGLMLYFLIWTSDLSEMSSDLLGLLGISVGGGAAAKYTTLLQMRLKPETRQFFADLDWYGGAREPRSGTASLHELLCTDGHLDIYKFQMAVFSLVTAIYVPLAGADGLGGVQIPEQLLYLMGISHLAYVSGKALVDRLQQLDEYAAALKDLRGQYLAKAGTANADSQELSSLQRHYAQVAASAARQFQDLYHIVVDPARQQLRPASLA